MEKTEFIRCPVCGNKTRDKIREDTVLKNFPLFCPKCKSECLIDIEQLKNWGEHKVFSIPLQCLFLVIIYSDF